MLGLLFLLLPIAAAYGWYMGQRSVRQQQEGNSETLSRQYVAGLNFLLSDEPDKAVDLFIDMLKVDQETIETHMALGNLFRRRGEVDRAIRIHQNLIARPQLPEKQREYALYELGQDYMQAGLYDRAEKLYSELAKSSKEKLASVRQLLIIYQQTREWEKAITVAGKLDLRKEPELSRTLAHCYCEQASILKEDKQYKPALALLKQALATDPRCVRASLLSSEVLQLTGKSRQAIRTLEGILEQDIDFVPEMLQPLSQLYAAEGTPDGILPFLQRAYAKGAGSTAVLAFIDKTYANQGREVAEDLLLKYLKEHPTIRGFKQLIEYHIEDVPQGQGRESLVTLRDMLEAQIRVRPVYRCQHCGFSGRTLQWKCPSCKHWGTTKHIRGLDGD